MLPTINKEAPGKKKFDQVGSHASGSNHDEWLISIMEMNDPLGYSQVQRPKIQKVPEMLRETDSNQKCYDPLVISIGPYHHGESKLQAVEKIKPFIAKQYVLDSGIPVNDFYSKVMEVADDARNCYAEGSLNDIDNEKFKKMMFLDGCFILQFIRCYLNSKPNESNPNESKPNVSNPNESNPNVSKPNESKLMKMKMKMKSFPIAHVVRDLFSKPNVSKPNESKLHEMKMKSHTIAYVVRDLFLLENQLPFIVLEKLMSLRFQGNVEMEMINKFIMGCRAPRNPPKRSMCGLIRKFERPKQKNGDLREQQQSPVHLLEMVWRQFIDPMALKSADVSQSNWSSYRSAKELRTVGIHLKPSRTHHFTNVEFVSNVLYAKLTLPRITIDDSTKSMLLNLVAYETCPDASDEFSVTSYVCFMDSLIDTPEDVKELRSNGILLNFLGSDEQVADLFNEIANDLVPNPMAYSNAKEQIEKHYNSRFKKMDS
ncbi:hypothetical protein O6P43_006424 [Quillaja saponaria]|uniref:Uncharacterized protein n=1 Tax=Quillaja saponaria TaxID=32244 RepID=A0AAD7VIC2_QUISA|nr:hypothetical protein O6P43_006424 [Quillaja saponaria]